MSPNKAWQKKEDVFCKPHPTRTLVTMQVGMFQSSRPNDCDLVQGISVIGALLGRQGAGSTADVAAADVAVTDWSAGVSNCDNAPSETVVTSAATGAAAVGLAAASEASSPALERHTPGPVAAESSLAR